MTHLEVRGQDTGDNRLTKRGTKQRRKDDKRKTQGRQEGDSGETKGTQKGRQKERKRETARETERRQQAHWETDGAEETGRQETQFGHSANSPVKSQAGRQERKPPGQQEQANTPTIQQIEAPA